MFRSKNEKMILSIRAFYALIKIAEMNIWILEKYLRLFYVCMIVNYHESSDLKVDGAVTS